MFSFVPRSQGEWGWAKNTGIAVANVTTAGLAISEPWFQVNDLRIITGSPLALSIKTSASPVESLPSGNAKITVNLVVRSTSVAAADLP